MILLHCEVSAQKHIGHKNYFEAEEGKHCKECPREKEFAEHAHYEEKWDDQDDKQHDNNPKAFLHAPILHRWIIVCFLPEHLLNTHSFVNRFILMIIHYFCHSPVFL
jgi:hypothetical protein